MRSTNEDGRLDALDRRGRAAARSLLDDLDVRGARSLVTEDASTEPAAIVAPEPRGRSEPTELHLDWPTDRGQGRGRRRRFVALAALAAVATVVGAVAIVTDDDRSLDVRSGGQRDRLLPGWLPEGMEPVHATGIPDAGTGGFTFDIAVYGDPDADDPWSAPVTVAHLVADEELLGGPLSGGEAVTVAGHDARVRMTEHFGEPSPRPAWEVEWEVDDGRLILAGELTREEVLAAAETATAEPAIDLSALPDGYAELARGPMVDWTLFTSLFEGAADGSGLAATYADPSDNDAVRTAVVVGQRPGPASAVDLLRLTFPDGGVTSVRGRHAAIGRGSELPGSAGETGVVAVQWAEPEGQLVTVVGFGVAEDEVLKVAEGLRPAGPADVAALRERHAAAAAREFGGVPDGHVVAASGVSTTGRWRIVADARRSDNIGSLTIERLWGAIASTSSTTGDRVEPPLDLQADISDGTIVVWGVLWVDATSVTVEVPGREPVNLGLNEIEGWSHPVIAGAFPVDHIAGSRGEADIVARDAAGREVARNSAVLSPDG